MAEKSICVECIDDPVLREWLEDTGHEGPCSYGHGIAPCVALEDFAARIDEDFQQYHEAGEFEMVPLPDEIGDHDHVQRGDPLEDILGEDLGAEPDVVNDLIDELDSLEGFDPKEAELSFYRQDSYVFIEPGTGAHVESWRGFSETSRHEQRFFSNELRARLESIFGTADELADGRSDVTVRRLEAGTTVYRGRRASDATEATRFMGSPTREMGAPPPGLGTGGRMNPAGVPVFYGASDEQTCVAELRAPVGGTVVTAGFVLEQNLRLLDLTDSYSADQPQRLSIFSPDFPERWERREFLRQFGEIATEPVQPHDSAVEFVPTQMVAEYVDRVLDLDGIIYRSTQSTDPSAENIAIFVAGGTDDQEPGLRIDHQSVRGWRITGIEVQYESHSDLRPGILGEVMEWIPQLIGRWNQSQMAIFASLTDPFLDHGHRAERLRADHDAQAGLVMELRFRVAGIDDPEIVGSLTPIFENYQERLALTERLISASLVFDDEEIDAVVVAYGALSSKETMRPLLERVYRHPDLVRIFNASGIDTAQLLDALLG